MSEAPAPAEGATEDPVFPGTLNEALLQFQAEAVSISKDAEADTGKYTYKYLTLDKLLEEVLPKLSALGLLWQTIPCIRADGKPQLDWMLTHIPSGQQVGGRFLLPATGNPQDMGSWLSYLRRYALVTALQIGQPDSDGQVQQGRDGSQQGVKKLTKANAAKIAAHAARVGCMDKMQMAIGHVLGGVDPGTIATEAEAAAALQKLDVAQGTKVTEWITRNERQALGMEDES